jgi:nucleoside-diphosphate-sugar epimerase
MAPPDPRPNLVVGCGYLGMRVAQTWRASGRRVCALTRDRAAELAAAGLEPVVGDVTDPANLAALPAAGTLLYAVGLDRRAGRSMREVYVGGLANVLDQLATAGRLPERFLYVSSTSVYSQTDGSWVDETSPTEPTEESGRVVLEAEQMLREKLPAAIVLRFAGIYGPGRVLRRQALLNGEPLVGDADKWLNLIHVADGVRALLAAEQRGRPGETYLVADGTPVTRRAFYTRSAELLGGPPARFEPAPPGPTDANRRVGNRKAREELGFVPEYPSYAEGLADS